MSEIDMRGQPDPTPNNSKIGTWLLLGGATALAAMPVTTREPEEAEKCENCPRWHRNPEGMGNHHYGKCDKITRWTHEGSWCAKEMRRR